jgi:tRNA (cytidine32/uridine32-2'-O)-methyltransferase
MAGILDNVDIILHRTQSSENIGAVARAMKNFGLRRLVLVSPLRYEASRAKTLAVHAGEILNEARLALTLEEAIAPYAMVIPTTERAIPGRAAPLTPGEAATTLLAGAGAGRVALLFGEEASGLSNAVLARFHHYSSIPSDPERRSLNLAQAVLLYAWEFYQKSGQMPQLERPDEPLANEAPAAFALIELLRSRARELFLANGFLNGQQPDRTLDELMRLLQRAQPTHREMEMLLAGMGQLERTSTVVATRS